MIPSSNTSVMTFPAAEPRAARRESRPIMNNLLSHSSFGNPVATSGSRFWPQQIRRRRFVGQIVESRKQFALILEPAIRFVEGRRKGIERNGGAALIGRKQGLFAHERRLLAQTFEFGLEQL